MRMRSTASVLMIKASLDSCVSSFKLFGFAHIHVDDAFQKQTDKLIHQR